MASPAMYLRDGDAFVGTPATQGGWNAGEAGGGPVLALLGQCLEDVPTLVPMGLSRFTADLMRPVPVGKPITVEARIVREGKKIQIVEQSLLHDGVELVRTSALRLRTEDLTGVDGLPADSSTAHPALQIARPKDSIDLAAEGPHRAGFLEAVDMYKAPSLDGTWYGHWLRLRLPVVEGEPVRPTARVTYAIDYANLIGIRGTGVSVSMINPDVSAHILRVPVGEWIAITGHTRFSHTAARGFSWAELSDEQGVFGGASTSQLLQPRRAAE